MEWQDPRGTWSLPKPVRGLDALELAALERCYRTGTIYAALDADFYCDRNRVERPTWLLEAQRKLANEMLLGTSCRTRGRAGNPRARFIRDLVDFARWDMVVCIREAQKNISEQLAILRATPNVPRHVVEECERRKTLVGRTWIDAFELASKEFEGAPAAGGPDAIEKSYKNVRRNRHSARYRLLHPATLRRLGLEHITCPKNGYEIDPIVSLGQSSGTLIQPIRTR